MKPSLVASSSMRTAIVTITPEMAKDMLTRNMKRNRHISASRIKEYADQMAKGGWILNGETIKITDTNELIDGQHRLKACVLSGVPFTTTVIYDVPFDAYLTIDIGRRRQVADALTHEGIPNSKITAASIRWIKLIQSGKVGKSLRANIPTPSDAVQWVEDNPDIIDSAHFVMGKRELIRMEIPSMVLAMHFVFAQKNRTMADEFYEKVDSGIDLGSRSPMLLLRKQLLADRLSMKKHTEAEHHGWHMNAWNAFRQNRQLVLLKGPLRDAESGMNVLPLI